MIRRASDDQELSWAGDLAAMVQVSIAAYAIAGLFLNLATFDLYYHLIAIVVIASALVRQGLASRLAAASCTTRRRPSNGHRVPALDMADGSWRTARGRSRDENTSHVLVTAFGCGARGGSLAVFGVGLVLSRTARRPLHARPFRPAPSWRTPPLRPSGAGHRARSYSLKVARLGQSGRQT